MQDPALIEDAKKSRRHIEVLTGAEMEELSKEVFGALEEIKQTVRKIFFE